MSKCETASKRYAFKTRVHHSNQNREDAKPHFHHDISQTFGNPAVSPESTADYTGLRESYLGSPEKSSPARQTTRMCVPLDASSLEKGEINSVLNSTLKTKLIKVELLMY